MDDTLHYAHKKQDCTLCDKPVAGLKVTDRDDLVTCSYCLLLLLQGHG